MLGASLAVLVAAGLGVGVQQRQVAASWQQRAQENADVRDDALGRVDALQRQLDEVADALAVSETDVVDLEDRVRELADEKAQAEDVATTTGVERDTLIALSSAIAGSIGSLDGCVDELFDLLNDAIDAFNRQAEGAEVDVGTLNAERTATTASCNAAKQDAADASLEAQQLLR
jgi:chromosome segregation ATPase